MRNCSLPNGFINDQYKYQVGPSSDINTLMGRPINRIYINIQCLVVFFERIYLEPIIYGSLHFMAKQPCSITKDYIPPDVYGTKHIELKVCIGDILNRVFTKRLNQHLR